MPDQQVRVVLDGGGAPEAEVADTERALLACPSVAEVRRGNIIGCPKCSTLTIEGEPCWVCEIIAEHPNPRCEFRFSATCAIPIECEAHELDVCAICSPCTCGDANA